MSQTDRVVPHSVVAPVRHRYHDSQQLSLETGHFDQGSHSRVSGWN